MFADVLTYNNSCHSFQERKLAMKVIFHPRFYEVYTSDPAAAPGRMEPMVEALEKEFEFVEPESASEKDLGESHGKNHIQFVEEEPQVYEFGVLAAGGAILAAETAFKGQPAFGLIRPPGHHASPHSCWGFCYFNNIAIAVKKLLSEGKINGALILDFDLHFGDGTSNTFSGSSSVSYFHPEGTHREGISEEVQRSLQTERPYDIIAISAGFDRHEEDWGRYSEDRGLFHYRKMSPRSLSSAVREDDSASLKEVIITPSSAEM